MSHVLIWEFIVPADRAAAFERAYRADGDWARLFAQGDGFLGTSLLRDAGQPGRFLTVDRWETAAHFAAFKASFGADYAALDTRLEGLAERETPLGVFND